MSDFRTEAKAAYRKKVTTLLDKALTDAVAIGKANTPVRTRKLQNSCRSIKDSYKSGTVIWGNTEDVNYQSYVARGTSKQAANPYDIRTKIAVEAKYNK